MPQEYLGYLLFMVSILVLAASGELIALPVLLPFAAASGYLTVRHSKRRGGLSLPGGKR